MKLAIIAATAFAILMASLVSEAKADQIEVKCQFTQDSLAADAASNGYSVVFAGAAANNFRFLILAFGDNFSIFLLLPDEDGTACLVAEGRGFLSRDYVERAPAGGDEL